MKGVYIQAVDGSLFTTSAWDGSLTPNGIAVITDNCSFVIALNDAYGSGCRWGGSGTTVSGIVTSTSKSTAENDYAGDSNTTTIINALNGTNDGYDDGAPAAEYCRAFKFPNGKVGYMGAAGEWRAALDNKAAIDSALSKCGGSSMSDFYWTSTQYDSDNSWYMYWNNKYLSYDYKIDINYVRAFAPLEVAGGKIINRATLRNDGATFYVGDFLYPVASDIVVAFYNPYKEGMDEYTVKSGTTYIERAWIKDLSFTPTEDDTYIYEIVFE